MHVTRVQPISVLEKEQVRGKEVYFHDQSLGERPLVQNRNSIVIRSPSVRPPRLAELSDLQPLASAGSFPFSIGQSPLTLKRVGI